MKIKLFGIKINTLPYNEFEAAGDSTRGGGCGVNYKDVDSGQDLGVMEVEKTFLEDKKVGEEAEKEHIFKKDIETKSEIESPQEMTQASTNSKALPDSDENPKTPSIDEDTTTANPPKSDTNDQSDATNSQQKTLKKPDKILPCPRCNSMDTKFCYYNNYNVNQPRHFCKNCQRYWTAGGTTRNMPVGAGRRKNKKSNPHCHYITISEPFQAARNIDGNGNKVLSFGSDSPILESMACALNLADKKKAENVDDCSSGSSITISNSAGLQQLHDQKKMKEIHGFPSQVPFVNPGVNPWPFPWNSAVPMPYPMPFYPPPYFGAWNFPWLPPPPPPPPPSIKAQVSDSNSPILGKHSREGELLKPTNSEEPLIKQKNNSVLIPKTLRIDKPDEAAKSSLWATLGIKDHNIGSRGGLFKAFQAKGEEKNHTATTSPALQANPAALSRSLCFQERA